MPDRFIVARCFRPARAPYALIVASLRELACGPRIYRATRLPSIAGLLFLRIVIPLYLFVLRMIFRNNRYPLFAIML